MKIGDRGLSPHCDVEDVAAHRAGHGHVSQTFPGHDHTGDEVRDGRPGRQDGQTHDLLRDAHSFTHLSNKLANTARALTEITFLPPPACGVLFTVEDYFFVTAGKRQEVYREVTCSTSWNSNVPFFYR